MAFCVVRDLGRMILIPFARCGETQPILLFAIQVNSPGNPRYEFLARHSNNSKDKVYLKAYCMCKSHLKGHVP